jgi:hypothetical protein
MSSPILASIQSYAYSAAGGAFSGGMLAFGLCKNKMKEMVVLGAVVNVVEKVFADLAVKCILRNPLAAANPIATAQKVLAVHLGGMFLTIAVMFAAALMYRRQQERQAQTDV